MSCSGSSTSNYNFDFEKTDNENNPSDWILYWNEDNNGYDLQLDPTIRRDGQYSLRISRIEKKGSYGVCQYIIWNRFKGTEIKLSGYVRTRDVTDGYAALWMRVDKGNTVVQFNNMAEKGLSGDNDWTKCEITLPYDNSPLTTISVGGLLTGSGMMWIDDLNLFIDGKRIDGIVGEIEIEKKAVPDTLEYYSNLGCSLDSSKIQDLMDLGILWGFLKYYNPAIDKKKPGWDNELFKIIPKVISSSQSAATEKILEEWVNGFDENLVKEEAKENEQMTVASQSQSEFDKIFEHTHLNLRLKAKLRKMYFTPRSKEQYFYYSSVDGNVIFKNEIYYDIESVSDVRVRLLSLYIYWNYIRYFYPYGRKLNWDNVLKENISEFVKTKNYSEYLMTTLKLICSINDTHADILNNKKLDSIKGLRVAPCQVRFLNGKLIIIGHYPGANHYLHKGDEILTINDKSIIYYVDKYLPYTSGSNSIVKLRNLSSSIGFLMRTNSNQIRLKIKRNNQEKDVTITTIEFKRNLIEYDINIQPTPNGYQLIDNGQIGYLYAAKLNINDLITIPTLFRNTKGLIIDLRCYPSTFMPFTYGSWLKPEKSPFAIFSLPDFNRPGNFIYSEVVSNGGTNRGESLYGKRKIVILVNEYTQSAAEYTVMALQTAPNAIVMGSTTAGADGNVSKVLLPGGIDTWFSGLGVFYPNGDETQNVGIKIDVFIKQTVKGITEDKDEVLERAIKHITNGKIN